MSLSYDPCSPALAARVQEVIRREFSYLTANDLGEATWMISESLRREGYRATIALDTSFLSDEITITLTDVEAMRA